MAVNPNCEGWPAMPPELQEVDARLTAELNALPIIRLDFFTPREQEILDHAAANRSVAQTANHLTVSPRTVESHRSNMFRKAGVAADMASIINLGCHSEIIPYTLSDSSLREDFTPHGALFVKCIALAIKGPAVKGKIGFRFSHEDIQNPKRVLGTTVLPRLVVRCYEQRLFIPKSQLPTEEDSEPAPGPV